MRRLLFAGVLILAACGGSDGGDASLAPLATPAASTTLAPLVTTTIAASTTSSSSSSTSSTTTPPGVDLVLRSDGLGDARFGVEPDGVVSYVTSILGEPDTDSGWVDAFGEFGTCPGNEVRGVQWGNLLLLFGDESRFASGRRHFFAWQYGPPIESVIEPLGPATDGGIMVGSSVRELESLYPDAEVYNDDIFGPGFEIEPTLTGSLTDDDPSGLVVALYGGVTCGE